MADFEMKLLNRIRSIVDAVQDLECLVDDMDDGTAMYDTLMAKTKNLLDQSLNNLSDLIIFVENYQNFNSLKEKLNG